MKKTNRIMGAALIVATLAMPVLFTGCGTLPPASQQTVDASAIILRSAARDGAVIAMTPPVGNTNNAVYFGLAASGISTFITGKDYSPGAFQTDLMSVNVKQLNDPYVKLGIGTVIDLYQLYYGLYVKPNVLSNAPVAIQFVTAVQDGFDEALGIPVSASAVAKSLKAHTTASLVLPRPIVALKPK